MVRDGDKLFLGGKVVGTLEGESPPFGDGLERGLSVVMTLMGDMPLVWLVCWSCGRFGCGERRMVERMFMDGGCPWPGCGARTWPGIRAGDTDLLADNINTHFLS